LVWGNMHLNRKPCRCGRAQQSFPWKPQPLTLRFTQAYQCSDRHLATGRAPHQPQTASSAASQCYQPCFYTILLFDVAQSQTVSLGKALCATMAGELTLIIHQSRSPATPTRRQTTSVNTSCFFKRCCPIWTRPCINRPTQDLGPHRPL
jgi:hypothetical protein